LVLASVWELSRRMLPAVGTARVARAEMISWITVRYMRCREEAACISRDECSQQHGAATAWDAANLRKRLT